MEQNSTRMPRPEGTTLLCMEVHKAKSDKKRKERKENLLRHLVNVYTMNGFRINGYSLSLAQFSNILGVKQERIQSILFEKANTLQAFSDPDQLKETANALASMCTTWAIQDRGLIQSQVETMMRAQDGTYRPFISAEVRQTLSALLQSNKQIAEIFKTFYSQGGININMVNNNQRQENILTIDKAYEIARESTPVPLKPADPRKAQVLAESTLEEIGEANNLKEATNLLRQYEHLDNSGWDRKVKTLSHDLKEIDPTLPAPTKKYSNIITDSIESKESIPISDSEYIEVYNGVEDINTKDRKTPKTAKEILQEDQGMLHNMTEDGCQDMSPNMIQEAVQEEKNPSSSAGTGTGKPAALKMGILPDTEDPLGPGISKPNGSETPSVAGIRKKKRPSSTTTKRPKNYTLSGTKLGQKVMPKVRGTGTSTATVSKPDKKDRHLKSDTRRAIPSLDTDKLPSRT